MKNRFVFRFLVCLFFCGQGLVHAQRNDLKPQKTPLDLHGGIGINLFNFTESIFGTGFETKVSPIFNVTGDLWVGRHFTAGLGYGFQRITITDTSKGSNISAGVLRNNLGIRALLHTNKENDKLDFYFGARIGYDMFSLSNGSSGSFAGENFFHMYMHQFLVGGKFVFTNNILIYCELGAGPPYMFNIGGGYRF
jgi:hypothetical protein